MKEMMRVLKRSVAALLTVALVIGSAEWGPFLAARASEVSGNELAAEEESSGKAEEKEDGANSVSGSSGETKAAAEETSADVPVEGVSLDQTEMTLTVGTDGQLTATVSPANASNKDVTWSVESEIPRVAGNTVVTVDGIGKVTPLNAGTATVKVTAGAGSEEKTAECAVTVYAQTTGVSILRDIDGTLTNVSGGETTIGVGTEFELEAEAQPDGAEQTGFQWSSSDSSVASVTDGKIVGKSKGTSVITVRVNGKSAAYTVNVIKKVTGISLGEHKVTLYLGETGENTVSLAAVITPEDADNQKVTWSSSDAGVAAVSEDGVVTAVKNGQATITVTSEDGKYTDECAVTVITRAEGISIDGDSKPENNEMTYGEACTLSVTVTPAEASEEISWTILSGEDVVKIASAEGDEKKELVTAIGSGEAELKVTIGSVSAQYTIKVNPKDVWVTEFTQKKTEKIYDGTGSLPEEDYFTYELEGVLEQDKDKVSLTGYSYSVSGNHFGVQESAEITVRKTGGKLLYDGEVTSKYQLISGKDSEFHKTVKIVQRPVTVSLSPNTEIEKFSDGTKKVKMSSLGEIGEAFQFAEGDIHAGDEVYVESLKPSAEDPEFISNWEYSDLTPNEEGSYWDIQGVDPSDFTLGGKDAGNYIVNGVGSDSFQQKGKIKPIEPKAGESTFDLTLNNSFTVTNTKDNTKITVEFEQGIKRDDGGSGLYWYRQEGQDQDFVKLAEGTELSLTDLTGTERPDEDFIMKEGENEEIKDVYVTTAEKVVYGPFNIRYLYDRTKPEIDSITIEPEDSIKVKKEELNFKAITDTPEGKIRVWGSSDITISISGKDTGNNPSGIYSAGILASKELIEEENLGTLEFQESITLPENAARYVYIRIEDVAGNVTYQRFNGRMLQDNKAPTAEVDLSGGDTGKTLKINIADTDSEGGTGVGIKSVKVELFDGIDQIKLYQTIYEKENTELDVEFPEFDPEDVATEMEINESISDIGYELSVLITIVDWAGNTGYYDHWGNSYEDRGLFEAAVRDGSSETFRVLGNDSKAIFSYEGPNSDQYTVYDSEPYFWGAVSVKIVFEKMSVPQVDLTVDGAAAKYPEEKASYDPENHYYIYKDYEDTVKDEGSHSYLVDMKSEDGGSFIDSADIDGQTVKISEFIIDTKSPVITISWSEDPVNIKDNKFYFSPEGGLITAAIVVKDDNLPLQGDIDNYFTLEVQDRESGETVEQSYTWVPSAGESGNIIQYETTVDLQGDGSFALLVSANDLTKCEKNVSYDHEVSTKKEIVIDTKSPEFDIVYEGYTNVVNKGEEKIYYYGLADGTEERQEALKAVFSVTEHNFYENEVVVTVTKDGVSYQYSPDVSSGIFKLEWEDGEEEVHTGTVTVYGSDNDGEFNVSVEYKDRAGHGMVKAEKSLADPSITVENGKYSGEERINIIDMTRPVAVFSMAGTKKHYDNDGDYYNDDFKASFNIEEINYDPSLIAVKEIKDGTEAVIDYGTDSDKYYEKTVKADQESEGIYSYQIEGKDLAGNLLVIQLSEENVNDSVSYNQKSGAFTSGNKIMDITGPEMEIIYDGNSLTNTHFYDEGGDGVVAYYNKTLGSEFVVKDNLGLDQREIHIACVKDGEDYKDQILGEEFGKEIKEGSLADSLAEDGRYRYRVYGIDKAGNPLKVKENQTRIDESGAAGDKNRTFDEDPDDHGTVDSQYIGKLKVVDKVAPKVEISYTEPGKTQYYDENGSTYAYYGSCAGDYLEAKYTIVEVNFDEEKLQIGYMKNNGEIDNYRTVNGKEDKWSIPIEDNVENDHYQFAAFGEDKAGNTLTVTEDQTKGPDEKNQTKGCGKDAAFVSQYHKVIDTIAPTFTLKIADKSNKKKEGNALGNRYYFNSQFSATAEVKETNYDAGRIYMLRAKSNGSSQSEITDFQNSERIESKSETFVDTISPGSGTETLYRYKIYGTDRAGNALVFDSGNQETKENMDGVQAVAENDFKKGGNVEQGSEKEADLSVHVVADTKAPIVDLIVRNNSGMEFYVAKLENTSFVPSVNFPYQQHSGASATFTGTDYSPLDLEYDFKDGSGKTKASSGYKDEYKKSGSATWEESFDGEQKIRIATLVATDLAGNESRAAAAVDGAVTTWMYLDVTPPDYDDQMPTVAMVPSGTTNGNETTGLANGPAGNVLYTSDVNIAVTVTDPYQDLQASGLYQVYYKVEVNGEDWTDRELAKISSNTNSGVGASIGGGVINYQTVGPEHELANKAENETLTFKDDLIFTFGAQDFNYNDVKLTVWGMDNSGNITPETSYAYHTFAIDVTNPKIRVLYDNNSVLNEKYFKEDRVATVEVTERNFDESKTAIETEDGASVGGWSRSAGGEANGDSDVWTCLVTYSVDGDYTFDVTTTDLAGNEMTESVDYTDSAAPQDFVLDKTVPVIRVSYDNVSAANELYYNAARVATLEVDEHNFNPSEVEVTMTAENDGAGIPVPSVNGWGGSGDSHTARIDYDYDGEFTFDVAYTDLAGNQAEEYTEDHFIIDLTEPEIEIVDVEDKSANNGEVKPGVNISDVNYDPGSVSITFTGVNTGAADFENNRSEIGNGQKISYDDIPHVRENDDIYVMTAKAADLAGNEFEDSVMFSVNRFGSTYILSDETEELVEKLYANEEPELTVTEINVDTLEFQEITYSRDGEIVTLKEGEDFSVEESGSEVQWKSYTYTIGRQNFAKEGAYTVTISSEDRATNKMNNKTAEKNIEFVIDKTAPSVVVTGVEDKAQYNTVSRTVTIDAQDNIRMDKVLVYLNGSDEPKVYTAGSVSGNSVDSVSDDEVEQLPENGIINIPVNSSNDWQTIRVVSLDKAGNQTETEERSFLVTTNLFYQWYRNKTAFYGSVGGVLAVLLAIGLFILLKRRKKEEQESGS